MVEKARLRQELIGIHPAPWVDAHMASFPDDYFRLFDGTEVSRHLEMMRELADEHSIQIRSEPEGGGIWRLDVVGYDAFQFLSTLCTLLAVQGLSILEGRVFTSQPPQAVVSTVPVRRGHGPRRPQRFPSSPPAHPDRRPRIVDVFRVRPIRTQTEPPNWAEFGTELAVLTQLLRADKYEDVHHRLIRRFVAALGPFQDQVDSLEPIHLDFDEQVSDTTTAVRIRCRDSFGFLSLTASALALCGIRIVQAEIRTADERVDDILWVTDRRGRKITTDSKIRELKYSLILIEHFSRRLPRAIDPEAALLHFSRFATETMARADWAEGFEALESQEVLDALVRVLGESHFLWEDYLHAQPENILPMICNPAEWTRHPSRRQMSDELASGLASARSFEQRTREIRRIRDREIFRADVRSILERSMGQEEFSAELADVAEGLLRAAIDLAVEETKARLPHGVPEHDIPAVLCALGKFGGRELGFASDLEVMLIYDDREVCKDPGTASAGAFFDSVTATLRDVLGSREGHAFDLDFRLRPYGRSGSPATSIATFLDYYRAGGPAWGYERQALIKLRVIAGDPALGRQIEAHRDLFVYGPEPYDLDCLHRMRRLQIEQLVEPATINAKYSPGALVDVEYFVQAAQIVQGGHDPSLRSPNTLKALGALGAAGLLTGEEVRALQASYRFFRTLIDALRVVRDHAKDLTVPTFDSDAFLLLSRRMRAQGPEELKAELERELRETSALTERLTSVLTRPRHTVAVPAP
jgi:glutamate-ammonia-ligase adenylyltransferase